MKPAITTLALALAVAFGSNASSAEKAAKTTVQPAETELTQTGSERSGPERSSGNPTRERRKLTITPEVSKEVFMLKGPDLRVKILNPSDFMKPAKIRVSNASNVAIPANRVFVVTSEINLSCEAGKLKSSVAIKSTQVAQQIQGPIAPYANHADLDVQPQSGKFSDVGCYYEIKTTVDSTLQVPESNENNNKASSLYCPGTSCY